ncbi:hypothetical protein CUN67_13005 [Pantoea cypripedii]|uniref:Uncharacterized protein n=2 Tax=Pantoea cypripedii TaxID=55209 RepID=A0A6B9GAU9_PANCY|nr:hypothetical protein CUN67_13005 [Pantoea cypripedii]
MEHQVYEMKGKGKPESAWTRKRDEHFGLWREVMRTEVIIDAPQLDGKELTELQIQSLIAERSDLEANFYIAKKRINERIASLQAIEHAA